MDRGAKPGNDFFLYANGTWLKTSIIPPDRSYAGVNLELNEQNEARLQGIVSQLKSRDPMSLSAEEQKLRDFYGAFLDQRAIESQQLAPAQRDLHKIADARSHTEVAQLIGEPALQLDGPFGIDVRVNDKKPNEYVVILDQAGLGMPNRDYYLRKGKTFDVTRNAYRKYLSTALRLAGILGANSRAQKIYALELEMAQAHWSAEERRDAVKTYNPITVLEIEKYAPGFPWRSFLSAASISAQTKGNSVRTLIAVEKSAFPKLSKIFAETPVSVWRDYLTVRYLHSFAACLPSRFEQADFEFYGTVIEGKTQPLDRATRGLLLLDNTMGEALGKLYVAKYFPPDAKAKAQSLVMNMLKAFEVSIENADWLTPPTRLKALEKLDHLTLKIGYPEHWQDYSALQISAGNLIQDVQNANRFDWNRLVVRIDMPTDKTEWDMTPQTNNAHYDAAMNAIILPAGRLQPPFFDPGADAALNYGGIGALVGHEVSHAFDDQGSRYDAYGILQNWWTDDDRKNFDARTAALVKQYDQYEPLAGIHINGNLTVSENIADLTGLEMAFRGYHIAIKEKPASDLGYTGDQWFFIAYAQYWREKYRDELLRERLLSNSHSPPAYRVNGVLRNVDGWYSTFADIKPGDKYYLSPAQRVRLW
jgi:putative endopeptidase